ncbi:MAG: NAD+ synthase [Verrucomicrobiota bacterium]
MKVGCLQLNATVGALDSNANKAWKGYQRALQQGAELVVAPELFLSGYPPRDLLNRQDFINQNQRALRTLAKKIDRIPLIIGAITTNPKRPGKPLYNSAAVLMHGKIKYLFHKSLLPTYDVFDEDRYFEPSQEANIWTYAGKKIGVTICEDIWNDEDFWPDRRYRRDPIRALKKKKIDLLINIAASPWHFGKEKIRERMLARVARDEKIPLLQVNLVGGNDELIFDGQSSALDAKGKFLFHGHAFDEHVAVIDFDHPHPLSSLHPEPPSQLFYALALGVRDYVTKCGFEKVVLGLSGGVDSAVTAAIAVEALGPDRVLGVAMPSQYSSPESLVDAEKLAKVLEIDFQTIPIQESFEQLLRSLKPVFGSASPDITEENLQARIRGLLLMAISNKTGRLLLTTGNKSEMAVGYCTLYGDMCGALAVMGDVLKTQVYQIAKWLNRKTEIIPWNTIRRAPSAELRPHQTDQDSLPPYDVLDDIIEAYVVAEKNPKQMRSPKLSQTMLRDIMKKIDLSEYKRRQAAPALKVSPKAFGMGRRRPIAQQFTRVIT